MRGGSGFDSAELVAGQPRLNGVYFDFIRGCPAKKQRDASKNRSHTQKSTDIKLKSFLLFKHNTKKSC